MLAGQQQDPRVFRRPVILVSVLDRNRRVVASMNDERWSICAGEQLLRVERISYEKARREVPGRHGAHRRERRLKHEGSWRNLASGSAGNPSPEGKPVVGDTTRIDLRALRESIAKRDDVGHDIDLGGRACGAAETAILGDQHAEPLALVLLQFMEQVLRDLRIAVEQDHRRTVWGGPR